MATEFQELEVWWTEVCKQEGIPETRINEVLTAQKEATMQEAVAECERAIVALVQAHGYDEHTQALEGTELGILRPGVILGSDNPDLEYRDHPYPIKSYFEHWDGDPDPLKSGFSLMAFCPTEAAKCPIRTLPPPKEEDPVILAEHARLRREYEGNTEALKALEAGINAHESVTRRIWKRWEDCQIRCRTEHECWQQDAASRHLHAIWWEAWQSNPHTKHPYLWLIKGYARRERERPGRATIKIVPGHLARIVNQHKTASLAEWDHIGDQKITGEQWKAAQWQSVQIDGEGFASLLPGHKPLRAYGKTGALALPGTQTATSLIMTRLAQLDALPMIDRRNPLAADSFFLMALGAALNHCITVKVDDVGAWFTGRFTATGIRTEVKKGLRRRAWSAINACRGLIHSGSWGDHPLPLLEIETGGLPRGSVRIWPFRWVDHGARVGYRLTGALANAATRQGYRGAYGRVIAGIEDHIASAGSPGNKERRSRLLIPERKGGPGPTEFVPYPVILARSGYSFDMRNSKEANAIRNLWARVAPLFEQNGYMIPNLRAEAEAGDTVEIVDVRTGRGRTPGGVVVRASARWVEAQDKVSSNRRGDALETLLLAQLFERK